MSSRSRARAGPLCLVAACISCSSDSVGTNGELVLALQTDMEIPKDIDDVRVEVLSFGSLQFGNSFPLGEGFLQVPATLGILAGDDPSRSVTIRVSSKRRGVVRTLREIVTTVPADRVALLRTPIQWLCDDMAEERADGAIVNTRCAADETCIAGRCVDRQIDPATLPDYRPELVFGGAQEPGSEGSCFDTVACFSEGAAAEVDPSSCSIGMPAGASADELSVAIVTAGGANGDGICGSDACLVPLDARTDGGWSEDGNRILLPEAVCERLQDGRAFAVTTTAACQQKTASVPTCGPWSSVTSEPGSFAGSPPSGLPDAGR